MDPCPWEGIDLPALTPFVKRLMVINVVVFVLMLPLAPHGETMLTLDRWFGVMPSMWLTEAPYLPFWQLVSYGFMHDTTGLHHLLFNMLGLYFFGTMVERQVGAKRFAIAYFGAMFAGGLAHVVAGWFGGAHLPVVGASGAVMGLSLPKTVWAMDRASSTLFHSEGDNIWAEGRVGDGLSSSSLAVTTVESLDGRRATRLESPATCMAMAMAL